MDMNLDKLIEDLVEIRDRYDYGKKRIQVASFSSRWDTPAGERLHLLSRELLFIGHLYGEAPTEEYNGEGKIWIVVSEKSEPFSVIMERE